MPLYHRFTACQDSCDEIALDDRDLIWYTVSNTTKEQAQPTGADLFLEGTMDSSDESAPVLFWRNRQ